MIAPYLLLLLFQAPSEDEALPLVRVETDNVSITSSCRVEFGASPIEDADGNGVLQVVGTDIVVDFAGAQLVGSAPATDPDEIRGTGVRVQGTNVTIRNARISGFKAGIFATEADGLLVERCEIRDGFRQRLLSTSAAENGADWLEPHENDANEWLTKYGAAVYVEDSSDVAIHDVVVRSMQNGILLDRVEKSAVYDNDCSFLSGWGIGLWRSSYNRILKNAVDFCVRGYSHGIYNRGQDSAGILMFEQSSRNVVAENSATHSGDGIFVFAGREALGERPPQTEPDEDYYTRRGCNGNTFYLNDLSYNVAHGLELTFSFSNTVDSNRLVGNGICGIWGGYSQNTKIHSNIISENGDMPSGLERGGVNIENGKRNKISFNRFENNACGVHLWGESDERLGKMPWVQANGNECTSNRVHDNEFTGDRLGVQIRDAVGNVVTRNQFNGTGRDMTYSPENARPGLRINASSSRPREPEYDELGRTHPVGERNHQEGRQFIVMTEWGPYDYSAPFLQKQAPLTDFDEYLVRSAARDFRAEAEGNVELEIERRTDPPRVVVKAQTQGDLTPYTLRVFSGDSELVHSDVLSGSEWVAWLFPWGSDPREDLDAWHAEAAEHHLTVTLPSLHLPFGNRGPSQLLLASEELRNAKFPANNFGTIATSKVRVPAGRWRLHTRSDDGIRVWVDGELLIDDWTHHVPTEHSVLLEYPETRSIDLRVEHFELTGFATLEVGIAVAD